MAPLAPIPNVAKVDLSFTTEAQPWHVIQHVQYGVTGTLAMADATDIANGFATTWADASLLKAAFTTNTTLEDITVTDLAPLGTAEVTVPTEVVGTTTGTALPMNACSVTSWKILSRYRGGKPRSYWSGMSEGNLANVNEWTPSFRTALRDRSQLYLAAINALTAAGGLALGSVAYFRGHVALSPPVFYPFVDADARLQVRTQRRRLGV